MFTYIIIGVVFAFIVEVCISNGWNPKAPKLIKRFNNFLTLEIRLYQKIVVL